MRSLLSQRVWILTTACIALGCINISIYSPEAEVREAAEEIVDEVRPEVPPQEPAPAASPGASEKTSGAVWPLLGIKAAYAEEKPDKKIELDVKSPVIKKIKETLKARYAKLIPFYEKGAVGEGKDGYLALRETDSLSLKEKRDVQALVTQENEDRKNLYTEIVKSNGIEEVYIERVGRLFSQEWQKKSKTGWWIESAEGKWEKKPKEEKKKEEKKTEKKEGEKEKGKDAQ